MWLVLRLMRGSVELASHPALPTSRARLPDELAGVCLVYHRREDAERDWPGAVLVEMAGVIDRGGDN